MPGLLMRYIFTTLHILLCFIIVTPSALHATPHKKLTFVKALATFNKKLDTLEQQYGPLPTDEKQRLQQKAFDFLWQHAQNTTHSIPSFMLNKVVADIKGYFAHQFNGAPSHRPYHFLNNHRRSHTKKHNQLI